MQCFPTMSMHCSSGRLVSCGSEYSLRYRSDIEELWVLAIHLLYLALKLLLPNLTVLVPILDTTRFFDLVRSEIYGQLGRGRS